jgi:phenylalanyl-tRNA synthetase beta chain
MPGLLQVVKYNLDHYSRQCSGYEVGRIHQRTDGQLKEQSACCILMTGKQRPEHWDTKPTDVDFYDLKGTVENVLNAFAQVPARFEVGQSAFFHPGRQAEIFIQDALVGYMGEVHPAVLKDLDIDQAVYFAEIHLHDLYPHVQTERYMTDLPQFPGSERDWTLTLKEAAPAQAVFDALAEIPSKLLKESRLLDVYRSEKLGPDRKNLTFRFTYRSDKKTLSQEAVDREHQRIEKQTEEKLAEWVLA